MQWVFDSGFIGGICRESLILFCRNIAPVFLFMAVSGISIHDANEPLVQPAI